MGSTPVLPNDWILDNLSRHLQENNNWADDNLNRRCLKRKMNRTELNPMVWRTIIIRYKSKDPTTSLFFSSVPIIKCKNVNRKQPKPTEAKLVKLVKPTIRKHSLGWGTYDQHRKVFYLDLLHLYYWKLKISKCSNKSAWVTINYLRKQNVVEGEHSDKWQMIHYRPLIYSL